ncbi:MAG: pyrroline-5-carboxylate reductase [Pseudomonadota bacterium]
MIDGSVMERGLVLLGCGKMGSAMLEGWLAEGLPAGAATVLDPQPSPRLQELAAEGLRLNAELPEAPALCLLAVKPQMMVEALPQVRNLAGSGTLFLSIAAGTPLAFFSAALGADVAIIRAMPNTPAAIGRGITALIGNDAVSEAQMTLAEGLLAAIGGTVRLDDEAQMDAVTALSGSGPAYVFHLIEAMTEAGVAEGLPAELALTLARQTVAGAGALAADAADPGQLRTDVTSPGGTTAAGLAVLMEEEKGLRPLLRATISAAARRSRELRG